MVLRLGPDDGLIFRIVHIENIPWILENGLHCRSSGMFDPNYRNIGSADLIQKRTSRLVPVPPGGTLSDYVPFYFTPRSPMLLNIKTGRHVAALPMREIVVLVSSLAQLRIADVPFVFTDRHAYLQTAEFFTDAADLHHLDWDILERSDFKYDAAKPDKMDRYQAEALAFGSVPVSALLGIACSAKDQIPDIEQLVKSAGHSTPVAARPVFFFS